ncbi:MULTISPECIES: hypothetical protein [unclassified Streptomyces]|nr:MULTISPECIES: hypothetical protein [unclassified Streptomyces]
MYPSLDAYDLQGVRPDEAALWGADIIAAVDDLADAWIFDAEFTD